jgi:hypothetical protein
MQEQDTGATSQILNVVSTGGYAVTVSDGSGCAGSDSIFIIFNPLLAYNLNTTATDCGTPNGSATISNLVGSGNYSISWSNGQVGGLTATSLGFGNYSVTVIDQNGCEVAQSFSIIENAGFELSLNISDATCNGGNDGTAIASISSVGVSPFTYAWSTGSTADSIGGLSAGSYFVTVEDANGCHGFDTATISEPSAISISVASVNSACIDSTGLAVVTNVTPAGTYTYQWNDYLSQTIDTASVLPAGVYTVTATNSSGCSESAFVIISNDGAPTLAMGANNTFCENGNSGEASVVASGTSPFTYQWNDGLSQTTDTATNLSNGLYFVSVEDVNGCIAIDSITVGFDNAAPIVGLGNDTMVCVSSLSLNANTGFATYAWSTGESTSAISVAASGIFTVTVTDANGCENSNEINVTINTPITITSNLVASYCASNTGSIGVTVLTGGGGYAYEWNTSDTAASLSGLGSGTYTLTITDTVGCESVNLFSVSSFNGPAVSINVDSAACFGTATGSATATVTGSNNPFTYAWSNGGSGSNETSLLVGVYDLTVTDDSGCVAITPFAIFSQPEMIIDITTISSSCGDSNGILLATVSGNQGQASYLWNTPQNDATSSVDSLMAGFYTLTVTDGAGCIAAQSVALSDSGAALLVLGSTDNTCSNDNSGTAFVIAFGNDPYSYLWNDSLSQSNDTAVSLFSGVYAVSVTDINGCVAIASTTVGTFYLVPSVNLGADITACNDNEVILTPGGQYASYVWSTGESTPSILAVFSITYSVQATDVNGCNGVDSVAVNFVDAPTVDLGPDTLVCTDDGVNLLTLDAGAGFGTYEWSTSESTQLITVNSDGTYKVTVSYFEDCVATDQVVVLFDRCINVSTEEIADAVEPKISIYPNPNRGQFILETEGLKSGTYAIQLVAINGLLIMNNKLMIQDGVSSQNEIDLSNAAKGIYMMTIQGESVRIDSRVIIQ